jgi:sec-independent protein translocase protein TatA
MGEVGFPATPPNLFWQNSELRRNMFEGIAQPMHLLIIAVIALLIFGPKKLPELGKGIGNGIRGFKAAINGQNENPVATEKEVAVPTLPNFRERCTDSPPLEIGMTGKKL